MNNKGFTAIETIISVILVSLLVIITMNFKDNIYKNELFINKYIHLQSEIDSNLTDIRNNWYIENYKVNTKYGKLNIKVNDKGINDYDNEVLEVIFTLAELTDGYNVNKSYLLERSVYYE